MISIATIHQPRCDFHCPGSTELQVNSSAYSVGPPADEDDTELLTTRSLDSWNQAYHVQHHHCRSVSPTVHRAGFAGLAEHARSQLLLGHAWREWTLSGRAGWLGGSGHVQRERTQFKIHQVGWLVTKQIIRDDSSRAAAEQLGRQQRCPTGLQHWPPAQHGNIMNVRRLSAVEHSCRIQHRICSIDARLIGDAQTAPAGISGCVDGNRLH